MPHSVWCRLAQLVLLLSLVFCLQFDVIQGFTLTSGLLSRSPSKSSSTDSQRLLSRRGLHQFNTAEDSSNLEDPALTGELNDNEDAEDWTTQAGFRDEGEEYEYEEEFEDQFDPELNDEIDLGFDETEEERFENLIKEEAHQEALSSGENPASLAAGTRKASANATIPKKGDLAEKADIVDSHQGSADLDWDVELAELEAEEQEFQDIEEEIAQEMQDTSKIPTLPDEAIERAINVHMPDPVPMDKSTPTSNKTATAHEEATLNKLKTLQDVVDSADLDNSLAAEKQAGAERVSTFNAGTPFSTKLASVGNPSQQAMENGDTESAISLTQENEEDNPWSSVIGTREPKSTPTSFSSGSSSEASQASVMNSALGDSIGPSLAIRVIAIIIAAVAGCAVAWGSIVLYNRLRPSGQELSLPKVIEIGAFTKKSPSYSRVRARGEEHQSGSWQDWDDDWDEAVGSQSAPARRGSSVKQKQKWDDDW